MKGAYTKSGLKLRKGCQLYIYNYDRDHSPLESQCRSQETTVKPNKVAKKKSAK